MQHHPQVNQVRIAIVLVFLGILGMSYHNSIKNRTKIENTKEVKQEKIIKKQDTKEEVIVNLGEESIPTRVEITRTVTVKQSLYAYDKPKGHNSMVLHGGEKITILESAYNRSWLLVETKNNKTVWIRNVFFK